MTTTTPRRYRVKDVVQRYGFPQSTVYHWVRTGQLNAIRIGGGLFIPASEMDRLDRLTRQAAA